MPLCVLLYVAVALLNYSVVQSLAGQVVSTALSEEWGGKVHVGSMSANLMGRIGLREVQLITPDGDTVANVRRLVVRYEENPIQADGLHLKSIYIGPTYFHLHDKDGGLTLLQFVQFLTDKFSSADDEDGMDSLSREHPFIVRIESVVARNIHYKQTLKDPTVETSPTGIDVPDMEFANINFKFRNVRIEPSPRITLRMERFSAYEVSGLHIASLRMNTYVGFDGIAATNMELMTDSSQFYGDVLMRYDDFSDFTHFFDSVHFEVSVKEGTSCSMKDASYWTNTLWGMDEQISLEGVVYGPLGDLTVEQMKVAFGQHTVFRFNGVMSGLPEIDNTYFNIHLQRLQTHYNDLAAINWSETVRVPFPSMLHTLGNMAMAGQFSGTIRNFSAQAVVATDAGTITAQSSMRYDPKVKDYNYEASIHSPGFQVSSLLANEWVSRAGIDISVSGHGFNPSTMTTTLRGSLHNTVLRGVPLKETQLFLDADNGLLRADLMVKDTAVDIDLFAMANLRDSIGNYELSGNVRHLDMSLLNLWNREVDSLVIFSTQLQSNLYGNDLEHLNGLVVLDNTQLVLNEDTLSLRNGALNVLTSDEYKNITFNSDVAFVEMKGYFNYSDLPLAVRRFAVSYLPRYYSRHLEIDSNSIASTAFTTFDFSINWLDTLDRIAYFVPSLRLARDTKLNGSYNFAEQLKLVLRSDSVNIGGMALYGMGVSTNGRGDKYAVDFEGQRLANSTGTIMEEVRLSLLTSAPEATAYLQWNNKTNSALNRGSLALRLYSTDTGNYLHVPQGSMEVNRDRWVLSSGTPIYFDDSCLILDKLLLRSRSQSVMASVTSQQDSNDLVTVQFDNFLLQQLNPLIQSTGFTMSGSMNGGVELRGLHTTPYFSTNLVVDSVAISGQELGTMRIASTWLSDIQQIQVELSTDLHTESGITKPITAIGIVDMAQKQRVGLDFDICLDGFRLQTLQPLVRGAVSELQGGLRGRFSVSGTTRQPVLTGVGYLDNGAVKIGATNVRYTFTDSIAFTNDKIQFSRFALKDPNGNISYVDGYLAHDNLTNFNLNLSLSGENLMVMNNTIRQSSYYGTLLAAVQGRVQGPLDDLDIYVKARTLPGSSLVIPVTQQRSVQDVNYIHFVAPTSSRRKELSEAEASQNAFRVLADLQITPDVQLQLPVDMSPMTADIKAKGSGILEVNVSSTNPISVNGDYRIEGGAMDIALLGLVTKDFTLEKGSSINFPGSLSSATFNLHAIYSQRVKLSPLVGSTADNAQTFVQVDNVINLAGSLTAPAVSFGLRLPNADQSLQEEVFSYIDTTNAQAIMNQTMSLLVLNQFYGTGNAGEPSTGGTSVVVNTLGGVLTDMIEFANVNIDYREATANSASQVEMGVSREWDKFYFESTFGYGGELRNMEDMNGVNNLTGDMLIGYKFNPMLHGYVFNRSNTNDYTRSDLPYKQGIGMKFVRDYDRWRDLFRSNKKVHARKQKKQQPSDSVTVKQQAADANARVPKL